MKRSEVMDLINEIEHKFPVDTWVIEDIHVWPIIRISLANQLYSDRYLEIVKYNILNKILQKISKVLTVFQGFLKFIIAYFIDFKHNHKNQDSIDIVFLSHSICRCKLNNYWYDRHCDPFRDSLKILNLNSLTLEYIPFQEYRVPRYQSSTFIQHSIDFITLISYIKVFFLKQKNLTKKLENYEGFALFLLKKNINIRKIVNLDVQVILIRHLADFFKKKLIKFKPVICFLVNYYGAMGMAFNLACRELDIISIDIQHGLQGEVHPAYASWSKLPLDGYELLPSRFWCWSNDEANVINQWSKKISFKHHAIVGGNLWLNMWQEQNNSLINIYDKKILELKNSQSNAIHILFTLQPRKDLFLADWILKVIKESPNSWNWWIRLHPGMSSDRKKISQLLKKCQPANIELNHTTDLPLLALLRHIDVHITHCSSTVIETESFGVPSIVTHIDGTESFPNQIASGVAIPAYTTEELFAAIPIQAQKKIEINYKKPRSCPSNSEALQKLISNHQKAL